jgi:hypothetical protein
MSDSRMHHHHPHHGGHPTLGVAGTVVEEVRV